MKILFLTFIIAGFLTGCGTTPYKTLASVAATVEGARQAYSDAVNLGKVTPEKQVEIDALVLKYQAAMNTAITAARFNLKAPAPADVATLASQVVNLINQLLAKPTK